MQINCSWRKAILGMGITHIGKCDIKGGGKGKEFKWKHGIWNFTIHIICYFHFFFLRGHKFWRAQNLASLN